MVIPYLPQFFEWHRINVHLTDSDPLEKISWRKLDVIRLSPDQERLGRNIGNEQSQIQAAFERS